MAFQKDMKYAAEIGRVYGEYLVSYTSKSGQVQADIFRNGNIVEAHVVFSRGLSVSNTTDPYVTDLRRYAEEQGFADRFQMIYSD
jgi:hypothetical protein